MILGIIGLALCWIPIFGWLVAVVGIVLGAIGWSRANKGARGKGMAITGVVCGIIGLLAGAVFFVFTMVAVKSFDRYIKRSQSMEARIELRHLESELQIHYMERGELPESATKAMPGPDDKICEQPNFKFPVEPASAWRAAGWGNFHIDEPSRFSYHWERLSATEGVALAVTDLDCDGVTQTTTMHVHVEDGNLVTTIENPRTPE